MTHYTICSSNIDWLKNIATMGHQKSGKINLKLPKTSPFYWTDINQTLMFPEMFLQWSSFKFLKDCMLYFKCLLLRGWAVSFPVSNPCSFITAIDQIFPGICRSTINQVINLGQSWVTCFRKAFKILFYIHREMKKILCYRYDSNITCTIVMKQTCFHYNYGIYR